MKIDAVFALIKHKPLGPFRVQDVRGTSALHRPKRSGDSGATLTDRWVAERSSMSINGVGSYHAQNYAVQKQKAGHSSSVSDFEFMGNATSPTLSNQGMRSFNKMSLYLLQAEYNGYCGSISDENTDYQKIISERRSQIYEKLKNSDTEEYFQIGGSSFTEKEWDKLLSEVKVSNFKEYETENYKFVPEPNIGGMKILINGESVGVFSVDDLKIRVDEKTGTRVLISEMGGYGGAWYDAIPVTAELEKGLAEAIGVEDISEVALEGYYIGTHAGTGIQYVMRSGDEGRGGKVLLRNEADEAKYNALAEEYYNRYPNLVTSQEYGRIYASFEICGMMERTATGFVRIGYDNISYNDNSDYKKNWSVKLTGDTWELLSEWLEENRSQIKEMHKFQSWQEIFDNIGGTYERIWSDEELKQGYLNN